MEPNIKNATFAQTWDELKHHHAAIANQHMRDWFLADSQRFSRFSLQFNNIFLDYSRNRILPETIRLLCKLAEEMALSQKIAELFTGKLINTTEKRPALHTALRNHYPTSLVINGIHTQTAINLAKEQMSAFVRAIHQQQWLGATGKPIEHIINIGIGGSHTGPMMSVFALKAFAIANLKFHFISSIDKIQLEDVMKQIDPEKSLFIISSKSFTTLETLTNARTIITWMQTQLGENVLQRHFIAITAANDKALALGLPQSNIFPLWDWVGGRYSIWSPIGLPLMLMIGEQHFAEFLQGGAEMDNHFRQTDFSKNIPVLLALLNIWYINFFGTRAHAIVPYTSALRYLIPYLQQAEMESNGKRIRINGEEVNHATSPVIFGEEGCNGQHTFHQLLHQGPFFIPADFILIANATHHDDHHQDIMLASALSQAEALMQGKTYEEALVELETKYEEKDARYLAKHQMIPGNRPCNIFVMDKLTPKNLGSLLALYEHKIFVQGAIWEINSFDQWGVELGKELLPIILKDLQQPSVNQQSHTQQFINYLNKMRGRT